MLYSAGVQIDMRLSYYHKPPQVRSVPEPHPLPPVLDYSHWDCCAGSELHRCVCVCVCVCVWLAAYRASSGQAW